MPVSLEYRQELRGLKAVGSEGIKDDLINAGSVW